MNKLQQVLSMLVCSIMLAACSSTGSSRIFIPQASDADQAVIYFYRPIAVSNAIYSPELYINGEPRLSLKNGQNSRLVMPAGLATIEIAPDEGYSGLTALTVELTAGTIIYIRLDTTLKLASTDSYEPYRRSFNLLHINEELAVREIAECCVADSRKIPDNTESAPAAIKKDESFSVDKTQNPFSH